MSYSSIAKLSAYLLGTMLTFLGWFSAANALTLTIVEPAPSAEEDFIGLWVRGLSFEGATSVNRLLSPTGEIFDPNTVLETSQGGSLLAKFGSLTDAIAYADGMWKATLANPRPPFPGQPAHTTDTFEFSIEGVSADSLGDIAISC